MELFRRSFRYLITGILILAALFWPGAAVRGDASTPLQQQAADGWSNWPSLSGNGEIIAFVSTSHQLVENDTNNFADIFALEPGSGRMRRISIASSLAQSNGWSYQPVVNSDGTLIAFTSLASNLAGPFQEADTNGMADVFLHDLSTRTTVRVSTRAGGQNASGWSHQPSISGAGNLIAFTSSAPDLAAGDENHAMDIFVHDVESAVTTLVSRTPEGHPGNSASSHPAISFDGRYIAFISEASNLSPDGGGLGIYLHDLVSLKTQKLPLPIDALGSPESIGPPVISADGRFVAFSADYSQMRRIYFYERSEDRVWQVTGMGIGDNAQGGASHLALSADGRFLAYPNPAGSSLQIYDRLSRKIETLSSNQSGIPSGDRVTALSLDADGSILSIASAPNTNPLDSRSGDAYILAHERSIEASEQPWISGWVSNQLGEPLPGVTITETSGLSAVTGIDGSFILKGPISTTLRITASYPGFRFSPERYKFETGNTETPLWLPGIEAWAGLDFQAAPLDVLEEARLDIGMPYSLSRGCSSPFIPCGGPFHGFYSGDSTDLIIDAYRYGLDFDLQEALEADASQNPRHYYRWRNARHTMDMWRYFAYTGMLRLNEAPYQIGDIVFFDWEDDGYIDHVAIVSEVNRLNRPTRILDATGFIEENPSGLATELEWRAYHANHAQGHVRINDRQFEATPDATAAGSHILFAVDSPGVEISIRDDQERVLSITNAQIPGGEIFEVWQSTVAHIASPLSGSERYFIELSGAAGANYSLGLQTVESDAIVSSVFQNGVLPENGELMIPVQIMIGDRGLEFNATLPGAE